MVHRSDYIEGKVQYTDKKNEATIGLEISDKSFFEVNFFSKCSKKLSISHMIMYKVCKRCLQPCFLRQKKNYGRTMSTSKQLTPLIPLRYEMQTPTDFKV